MGGYRIRWPVSHGKSTNDKTVVQLSTFQKLCTCGKGTRRVQLVRGPFKQTVWERAADCARR